ncbi:MAG: carrier protein YMC2 [Piptocephalis tieghemiana]|nr:MAG: carrier protein YMC2 [Piptocephalis tieghemiana]
MSIPDKPATWRDKACGFLAGVTSGATKLTVGHPFDTIKIRMQVEGGKGRFKGPLDCLLQTIRKEGYRGLYKGATPPLIGWAFMDSIMLGSLTNYRILLQGGDLNRKLNLWEHGVAGMAAGWTVSVVATPVELIKARLQVQYDAHSRVYSGPIDCAQQLVRQHGVFPGLWKGFGLTLAFRSFFGIYWSSYEWFCSQFRQLGYQEMAVNFLSGGLAAQTFWCFNFPVDVVKNRWMTQPDIQPPRWTKYSQCVQFIYQTEGIRGFYRGFLPSLLRSFPTNACALMVFEGVMRILRPSRE